jgi:hypothetical protein
MQLAEKLERKGLKFVKNEVIIFGEAGGRMKWKRKLLKEKQKGVGEQLEER